MEHLTYQETNNKVYKAYYDKFKKMVKQDLNGDGWFLLVKNFPFKDGEKLMFTSGEDIGKWREKNLVSLYGKKNYIIGRLRKRGPIVTLLDFQEGDYVKEATEAGLRKELKEYFKGTGVGVRVFKSLKVTDVEPEDEEEEEEASVDVQEDSEEVTVSQGAVEFSELEMPALKPSSIQAMLQQALDLAQSIGVDKAEEFISHLNGFKKAVPRTPLMKIALEKLNAYLKGAVAQYKAPSPEELSQAKEKLKKTETDERTGLESAVSDIKVKVGEFITGDVFGKFEKDLQSTAFKWNKTIRKTLDSAKEAAKKMVKESEIFKDFQNKLMNSPAADIKDEIAKKIGGMRAKKYGEDSHYRDLSANKKALVDAIYEGMMAATVSDEGELEVPEEALKEVRTPGLAAEFKKAMKIDDAEFKKGEKCVYVEVNGVPHIQRIKKKEGSSEGDLDEFEVDTSKLYKLPKKDDVKLIQSYKKTDEPLFDGPVSVSDIKQGAIGDCYLIAGIYTIANRNPQHIHNMIKDNGNGTVTVRLFEKKKGSKKLEPKFVTFEKSTLTTDEHAQDSLWVQMLEKAYAIHIGSVEAIGKGGHSHDVFEAFLGVNSEQESIRGGAPKLTSVIGLIPDMGMTESGFSALKSRKDEFDFTDEQLEAIGQMDGNELINFKTTIRDRKWGGVFDNFFEADRTYREMIKNKVDKQSKEFKEAFEAFQKESKLKEELGRKLGPILSTKDMKEAMRELLLKSNKYKKFAEETIMFREEFEEVIEELKAYARKNPTYSLASGASFNTMDLVNELEKGGKKQDYPPKDEMTGTGMKVTYNENHLAAWEKIEKAVKLGKYIGCGTIKEIGISTQKGHSGGESMVKGLAGQHAYSVMDVADVHGRKFIRVANPWGSDYSRDYDVVEGRLKSKTFTAEDYKYLPDPEKQKGGGIAFNESWIELREFVGLFNNLYIT